MPVNNTTTKKNPIAKDEILHAITAQLLNGLTLLKGYLGDKKYEKRIKKAAKLLVEGIKNPTPKNPVVTPEKAASNKVKTSKSKTPTKVTKGKAIAKIPTVKKVETVVKTKTKK